MSPVPHSVAPNFRWSFTVITRCMTDVTLVPLRRP